MSAPGVILDQTLLSLRGAPKGETRSLFRCRSFFKLFTSLKMNVELKFVLVRVFIDCLYLVETAGMVVPIAELVSRPFSPGPPFVSPYKFCGDVTVD